MNNWHKTPNYIYDAYSEMKEAELRLTVWLVRHTYGFHRGNVQATSKEIQEQTGLSKQGLINAQNAVQERGFFVRVSGGYEVNEVDQKVNQIDLKPASEGQRSRPSRSTKLTPEVNEVDPQGQLSRPSTSSPKESFKEVFKEKEEKEEKTPPPVVVESHFEREETDNQKAAVAQMNGITPKHPLTVALQKITLGVSIAKLLSAAYQLHQLGATPEDLLGFTEWGAKNNLKGLIYPSQVVANWLKYKPAAGVKVDLREALTQLRGIANLRNGEFSLAWGQLPQGVKEVLSSEAKRNGCKAVDLLALQLA
jgi:hypothetical protein